MAQNRLDYQAQLSRHPHNVEGGYAASLCTGAIVPQYFDVLQPGDSVYYRTHMFARLQDLVTAFLGEVDIHLDYFFVPLQMLYTPCGQIFTQTNDFLSSIYADSLQGKDSFPLIKPDLESIQGTQSSSLYGTICPEDTFHETIRLFDALDANPLCVFDNDYYDEYQVPQDPTNVDFSLCNMPAGTYWAFLAYQAIYQKYYRNDELERLNVSAYNVDSLYNQTHFNFGTDWFKLRYHQRVGDFFTTMRPSPIMSSVNSITGDVNNQFPINGGNTDELLSAVNTFLGSSSAFLEYPFQNRSEDLGDSASTNFLNGGVNQSYTGDFSSLNANNIRALFAVDKYTRIYGRADKTYDDQILAHFGIHIPHDVKHDLTHLKHYRAVLQADPIYGTANVANGDDTQFLSTIGQVGGQGQVTLDTQEEKFTAPVHGIFMCVAYALTKPRYIDTFSPLHLISNRLDLPIAEYDKLGAQPMYRYMYNRYYLQDGTEGGSQNSYMSSFSGWINRYQQYKRKYNRVSLLYATPENGHLPADAQTNVYAPYVLSRNVFGKSGSEISSALSNWMDSRQFFEHPNALDSIMVRHYDGMMHVEYWKHPHLALQSDPILTDFMCYCKKVSWMSETGEPDL